MKTTTLQLLPTTSYGTPSGNYDGSSLDFNGDREQAANYYGGFGDLQTIAFFVENFQGRIRIQASLDTDPTLDDEYFQVYDYNTNGSQLTASFAVNITGNFVWIRARVEDFLNGTIDQVQISY